MKLKKYRPNFFTGLKDEYFEINTRDELFSSKLCKPWLDQNYVLVVYANSLVGINNSEWLVVSSNISDEDSKILGEWIYTLNNLPSYKNENRNSK